MKNFILTLEAEFIKKETPYIAIQQKAYMRNRFEFYGLKSPERRQIQRPFLVQKYLPKKIELESIVKVLWQKPQREYHYFTQELALKYIKQMEESDIALYEYMVTHQSWWDTVDFIAIKLIGAYFKSFPEKRAAYITKWLASDNFWLQRSAILFQLKYKESVDTVLLSDIINKLLGSKEFFINKAIGWMLREYSKTKPTWVKQFADKTTLSKLSRKEALRLIG